MEHVVFFPGPEGAPAFRRFSSLDDVVRFVEHLRNAEGVSEVSVHGLSPVPVAFRAYYKVEVPPADMPVVPEQGFAPLEAVAPVESVEAVEPVAQPEPVAAMSGVEGPVAEASPEPSSNGKRSLGFFAH
ncbi:MAG: hypothetical protein JO222_00995 [Frankiales bacterium]|nr:hypothetical protein [Frankiales bacterium]